MTRILLLLSVVVRTFCQTSAVEGLRATRLGENCRYDVQCQQVDSNSECTLTNDQRYRLINICTCKLGYRVEIINNTEKCVVGELPEEEKEGLTAAPIILCFMGCVIVEAFCLLAFRYWKKNRRHGFPRHHTLHLEAFPLSTTRIPHHSQNRPLVSFMITSQVESSVLDARANSPPPYSQTAIEEDEVTEAEEPPPTYEEAMKQLTVTQPLSTVEQSHNQLNRKMSC